VGWVGGGVGLQMGWDERKIVTSAPRVESVLEPYFN